MNQKKAKILSIMEFVSTLCFLILGTFSVFGLVIGRIFGIEWLLIAEGAPYFAAFIVCMLFSFVFGNLYVVHKDAAAYDEFGVRYNEKRRMKLNSEERRLLELQSLAEMERILPKNTIAHITKKGSKNPEEDLNRLVGIDSVKTRLFEMKARMEFDGKKRTKNESHHMVFYGNPGTGKTTVARIVTGILYKYRYISKNKIVEVDGNFLKSYDPSSTETKVRCLCRAAYGGVLFVDEAYSLVYDDIGLVAIATLIKEMEDHRGNFVVIFAGYHEPMSFLLSANPGFESRIKEYLNFPDYSQEELFEIFCNMAREKGLAVDSGCKKSLAMRFSMERELSSWGNARTVRNVLEETIDKHAVNFLNNGKVSDKKYVLFGEDVCTEPVYKRERYHF